MTVWAVLLRGVNVGGNNKVPMAELRAALAAAGCQEVATYIASGNIVLSADDDPAPVVTEVLADRFGLDVAVVSRTAAQIRATVAANPFAELAASEPKAVHCYFTSAPVPDDVLADFDHDRHQPDLAAAAAGELFAAYPDGMARSRLTNAVLDRVAGGPTTARNWNTVRKLEEMVTAAGG